MKRITMGLCIAAALAFAAAPSSAAQTKKAAKMGHEAKKAATGYTGCVAAGTAAGTYQLTNADGQSGPLALSGKSADLAKHVGHKVTVNGKLDGSKVTVKSLTMVAPTCP
jgi:hypothetical protein